MEIIYLISQGNLLDIDRVTNLPARQFLFIGEYLLKKRKIESKRGS